ncbi:hypothetical protein [Candidatus Laterigemmans baculatus]|uniref:hypothetical protein n=1 Tax=Candidatus Laterigemmans baculatus TaxID=2770505 RepID=UPI0013DAB103|nr:hypothetical protein [Candidatus Laterigemmans baculatus]
MREDLLGYLLGALEPDEMERVERALRDSPALRAELDRLQASLRPLEEAEEIFEPPADLLSRTWDAIDRAEAARSESATGSGAAIGSGAEANDDPLASPAQSSSRAALSPAAVTPAGDGWRWVDFIATSLTGVLLAGLVLPGILRGRFESRREACQANLREAGVAVVHFATREPDRRMPQLSVEGPQAFSGMYAVELREAGLMPKLLPFWCPSLDVPSQWVGRPVPSEADVMSASPQRLGLLQKVAGGHYAYSLGVREQGRYAAPRFEGRADFAILADAPVETLDGWTTAHEGRGFNLLFEDGRVRFFATGTTTAFPDHPFLNHRGEIEAGVDANDATLAPSWRPPFLQSR